jgi:hypothetical protein
LPEGNAGDAFSFNAAIGIFILSIAAILPLSGLKEAKRTTIRRLLIPATLYSYAVETIQHLRGIPPRFTREGSIFDAIISIGFGLVSMLIIIATVMIAIPFFKNRQFLSRPFIISGIQYAFISVMVAFAAGVWMSVLQGRYTGEAGNLIVLHGIGFHALQALPLLCWLAERSGMEANISRKLIHTGGIAWTTGVVMIGLQTALGRTVFEPTVLPLLAGVMFLVWLCMLFVIVAALRRERISVTLSD